MASVLAACPLCSTCLADIMTLDSEDLALNSLSGLEAAVSATHSARCVSVCECVCMCVYVRLIRITSASCAHFQQR